MGRTKYLEWDKVTKMTCWKTFTNTVSSTLISYAFTRVNFFIRVTQELTRLKWLYYNISARDISRIIFTSLVCHVLQITCSFIHDTFSEHVDFLFTTVPFILDFHYSSAVWSICRIVPSHKLRVQHSDSSAQWSQIYHIVSKEEQSWIDLRCPR